MIEDPFIILGIILCFLVLGLIMALQIRDKRKKPPVNFDVPPPF